MSAKIKELVNIIAENSKK